MFRKFGFFMVLVLLVGCAEAETAVNKSTTILAAKVVTADMPTAVSLAEMVEGMVGAREGVVGATAVAPPSARRTVGDEPVLVAEEMETVVGETAVDPPVVAENGSVPNSTEVELTEVEVVVAEAPPVPANDDNGGPLVKTAVPQPAAESQTDDEAEDVREGDDEHDDDDDRDEHDDDDDDDHDDDDEHDDDDDRDD
ncbi:MAG: hypothetical protein H6658_08705 [Ardenticatenaceae bacterium]|nr:hypothetical protein [Ardenticatenaceae bacterium]